MAQMFVFCVTWDCVKTTNRNLSKLPSSSPLRRSGMEFCLSVRNLPLPGPDLGEVNCGLPDAPDADFPIVGDGDFPFVEPDFPNAGDGDFLVTGARDFPKAGEAFLVSGFLLGEIPLRVPLLPFVAVPRPFVFGDEAGKLLFEFFFPDSLGDAFTIGFGGDFLPFEGTVSFETEVLRFLVCRGPIPLILSGLIHSSYL